MVNNQLFVAYYKSPIGWIEIKSNGNEIIAMEFVSKKRSAGKVHPSLLPALRQLHQYFIGKRKHFFLKLNFQGTPFQQAVWKNLQKIKFAHTASYQNIASLAGRQKAARAAGTAVGKNRITIVIPCHRVIASSGGIAGYAGGVWRKRWLLKHESSLIKNR